jgi:hypothetical protein
MDIPMSHAAYQIKASFFRLATNRSIVFSVFFDQTSLPIHSQPDRNLSRMDFYNLIAIDGRVAAIIFNQS